jgi:glucokinase
MVVKGAIAVGIDVGGTQVKVALVNRRGRILVRGVVETDPRRPAKATLEEVARAVRSWMPRGRRIAAVGLACAGLVDGRSHRLLASPNLPGWPGVDLERLGERLFGVPTRVDNDANAAAWGEYRKGAGRGTRTFLCLTLGTGVGGGIVVDGRLLRGARNWAAEVGHVTVDARGPRCRCGNRGCLEAFVGSYGWVREARGLLRERRSRILSKALERGERLSPRTIAEAARRGDGVAREVIRRVGGWLGVGLAGLVNLFNPERIALGGGVAASFDLLYPHLRRELDRRAFDAPARLVDLRPAELGVEAAALGAALMAWEHLASGKQG